MRKALIIALCILLIILTAIYCVSVHVYKSNFDTRYESTDRERFQFAGGLFPALQRERHEFESIKGDTLIGYLYTAADGSLPDGIVVFAHGLGRGGHSGYMKLFDYLVKKGYCVFAYDATANDESEGNKIAGLPQGVADLDRAICYVQTLDSVNELPLFLMGYSWGGYSVVNVLGMHPEVKAICSLAGFNKSTDLVKHRGYKMVGNISGACIPFVSVYEFFHYGKYACQSGMKSFASTDSGVMIVHSEDDGVVPFEYGYGTYAKKYADDERFLFVKYTDRGHSVYKGGGADFDTILLNRIIAFFNKHK